MLYFCLLLVYELIFTKLFFSMETLSWFIYLSIYLSIYEEKAIPGIDIFNQSKLE